MTRALVFDGPIAVLYGRVDLARWQALEAAGVHLHCYLDGLDVTWRCMEADDQAGEALLYLLNAEGQFYRDPKNPWQAAQSRQRGLVELREEPHEGSCRNYAQGRAN